MREDVFDADWMPDGSRLVLAPSDSATRYIQLPPGVTVARSLGDLVPMRAAPSGDLVAFWQGSVDDIGGDLALAGPRTAKRMLCRIGLSCTGLAWHPRTGEVWYSEVDSASYTRLCAVSTSGRQRTLLHIAGLATLHDIAPDGSVLLSLESSRAVMRVLAPGLADERDLSWFDGSWPRDLSPSGQTLLFDELGATGGPTGSVYLRSTDGSPAVRLGDGISAELSPDGRWVSTGLGSV